MATRTISQENKEFQYMKLTIHAFYVAIVIRNPQLCCNGIQVTIISITGLTCLAIYVVHSPYVF